MSDEETIGDNVHLSVCGDVILFEDGKEEIASKELNGYLGDGYWKHHDVLCMKVYNKHLLYH